VAAATVAGRAVFHIERPDELEAGWFRDAEMVGLTAGTSTLKENRDPGPGEAGGNRRRNYDPGGHRLLINAPRCDPPFRHS